MLNREISVGICCGQCKHALMGVVIVCTDEYATFKYVSADGSQLKREDIVANLPEAYQHIAQQQDAAWTFISQIEHPHLNSPWYMLHPCQTSELLGLMLHSKETASAAQNSLSSDSGLQYMTAWFSLVGPPLCLHLDDVMLV